MATVSPAPPPMATGRIMEVETSPRSRYNLRKSPEETVVEITEIESSPEPASVYGPLIDANGNEFVVPDFTVQQIRAAIPAHCFERSALHGYTYVARDIAVLATVFYLFNTYATKENVPSFPLRFALWSVYAFIQGLFATGIWVLAHECGHQSFSSSKLVNDITGWVMHSALLVPYFSWKISHGQHHKATGNMERDMVFVPKSREYFASLIGKLAHELDELAEEAPLVTLYKLVFRQVLGWPVYLMTNQGGHDCHEKAPEGRGKGKKNGWHGGVNHFDPKSPLFTSKEAKLILLSDLGLAIAFSVLGYIGFTYGFYNLFVWYFIPYLCVNHWLVAITYLQHTDPSLAHYHSEEWTFARGAASTIDRDFGFIGKHVLHGIIETHVLHHYVSTIPFYNAWEATEAIKPVMGIHYRKDNEKGVIAFLRNIYKNLRVCQWVEASEGSTERGQKIVFYRNRNGLGTKPLKMPAQQ